MKKILLVFCLIYMVLPAAAQKRRSDPAEAKIEFNAVEHNFGRIPERGRKVSCTFRYTNTGDKPLVITRITTTCKCVDYSYSKKPVAPGETGTITISYNPKKQEGVFYKVVQIYANTPDQRHVVTVRGEVVPE